ncbi:hypothetical protein HAX54_039206, partial [Datura stramonium]|nr:hypothetical protein [Datura stramonium]
VFNLPKKDLDLNILECIRVIIAEDENERITEISMEEEIHNAVLKMSEDSSAGPR